VSSKEKKLPSSLLIEDLVWLIRDSFQLVSIIQLQRSNDTLAKSSATLAKTVVCLGIQGEFQTMSHLVNRVYWNIAVAG